MQAGIDPHDIVASLQDALSVAEDLWESAAVSLQDLAAASDTARDRQVQLRDRNPHTVVELAELSRPQTGRERNFTFNHITNETAWWERAAMGIGRGNRTARQLAMTAQSIATRPDLITTHITLGLRSEASEVVRGLVLEVGERHEPFLRRLRTLNLNCSAQPPTPPWSHPSFGTQPCTRSSSAAPRTAEEEEEESGGAVCWREGLRQVRVVVMGGGALAMPGGGEVRRSAAEMEEAGRREREEEFAR